MSKTALIIAALAKGPQTTTDLEAATGIPRKLCSSLLYNLDCRRRVRVIGKRATGAKHSNVYEIPAT